MDQASCDRSRQTAGCDHLSIIAPNGVYLRGFAYDMWDDRRHWQEMRFAAIASRCLAGRSGLTSRELH
jgi:hypothetical protein